MTSRPTIAEPMSEPMAAEDTTTLERAVVAVLADAETTTSAHFFEMVSRTEAAISSAEQYAVDAEAKAHDPTATPDIKQALAAMTEARLSAARLRTLLPRLTTAAERRRGEEQHTLWLERYTALEADIAADAAELAEYPELIARIVAMVEKNELRAQQISRLNSSRVYSSGTRPLRTPELIARDVPLGSPSIFPELRLPNFEGGLLYPPPVQIDPMLFAPVPFDPRFSDRWWEAGEAQRQQREAADADQLERERRERDAFYGRLPGVAAE